VKSSVSPTTAIIVVIVVVAVVALVGWQLTHRRPSAESLRKPGVGGSATQGPGGPPPGSPMFKGDPTAVPASGTGGPASGGAGGGAQVPPAAKGPQGPQPAGGQ